MPKALLIAHNYSNRTGYAWANIVGLFGSIAGNFRAKDYPIVFTFSTVERPVVEAPVEVVDAVEEHSFGERSLSSFRRLVRILRTHDVGYVYLTDQAHTSLSYLIMRIAGVRRIIVHSRISVPDPYPVGPEVWWKRLLKWVWVRIPGIQADRVYAVSDFVRHRLLVKAQMPRTKVCTIYNGVDLAEFTSSNDLRGGKPTIFVGCRATVHKGLDTLIRACKLLRHNSPVTEFRVRYAGDGPDLERLRALVLVLGLDRHFEFLGEIRDVAEEISRATIVVVPSNWGDACPTAVLEALACGKPLVATRAGGIPELVSDGVTGLLVAPGDAAQLATAIGMILSDTGLRSRLGSQARADAEARFDVRRYHREVLNQLTADGFR